MKKKSKALIMFRELNKIYALWIGFYRFPILYCRKSISNLKYVHVHEWIISECVVWQTIDASI